MGAFVVYILEWSACLLLFLLLYKMCFSGTTFHRFNRLYLLGTTLLSAVLPLVHIAPSQQMEPMAESCRTSAWVDESPLTNISFESALEVSTDGLTVAEKGALVLLIVYLLYVLTQLVGWGKAYVKMLWFLRGKRRHKLGHWIWLVEHDGEYGPFSWMNHIVISSHEEGFGRRASIRHELSHILLLHHIDLLLTMICVIINPVCWLVMKEIKIVHEYEADDEVINHYRIQSRDYQRLLILRTVGAEAYALASSFNLNIKKRIIMMKKKQSNWWRMTWIAVTLPLIGVSLMAFSKPKEALQEAVDNSVKVIEQPLAEMMEAENVEVPEVVEAPAMPAEQPQKKSDEVKAGTVVKGTVCGQDGKKLQYATVVETDEIGRIVASAQTDNNGSFSLKVVNPQHKLRVSYVGFKSASLAIADQMNVTLEPATMMTDVVVRGVKDSIDKSNPRYNDTALDSGDDTVFNVVEQMPSFPGGNGELMKYLSRKLMFPPVAREMSVEADITVKFTVDKTGFVRAPQVVSVSSRSPLVTAEVAKAAKDGDEAAIETSRNYADAVEALKEEAIHVVRTMPRWEPGRQNGKRIDTSYTLPINFKLN
jgi:hypothetical protein